MKIVFSLLLFYSSLAFGHNFDGCTERQMEEISSAAERAQRISLLVMNETNPAYFIKWFGLNNDIGEIQETFSKMHYVLEKDKIDFSCNCLVDAYAYSISDMDYIIHVCNRFWAAPRDGLDSKSGTIIHELSHFNSIGRTFDSYREMSACLEAAKMLSSHYFVLKNANTYEYMAENLTMVKGYFQPL